MAPASSKRPWFNMLMASLILWASSSSGAAIAAAAIPAAAPTATGPPAAGRALAGGQGGRGRLPEGPGAPEFKPGGLAGHHEDGRLLETRPPHELEAALIGHIA